MGRYEESLTYFDKAIEKNPTFTNAFINKAESLRWLKRFEEAIRTVSAVLDIDKQNVRALNILGLIFIEQQKYIEAEQKFLEAYTAQRNNINIILNLIVVHS